MYGGSEWLTSAFRVNYFAFKAFNFIPTIIILPSSKKPDQYFWYHVSSQTSTFWAVVVISQTQNRWSEQDFRLWSKMELVKILKHFAIGCTSIILDILSRNHLQFSCFHCVTVTRPRVDKIFLLKILIHSCTPYHFCKKPYFPTNKRLRIV